MIQTYLQTLSETDHVFRSISIFAAITLFATFIIVVLMSHRRYTRGENGYTKSIMYWAIASVLYTGNELLRLWLMGMDSFSYRGLILVIGSAITRVTLLVSLLHLLIGMNNDFFIHLFKTRKTND